MTTSTRESATDKLFDFLIERQASLFGVVGTATERYHRFNGSVIESARQSSLGWTDVGKRWLASPGDIIGLYEAASEAINNDQARALALITEWLDDRAKLQSENRESLRRSFGGVRDVMEHARASAPALLRRSSRGKNDGDHERATV